MPADIIPLTRISLRTDGWSTRRISWEKSWSTVLSQHTIVAPARARRCTTTKPDFSNADPKLRYDMCVFSTCFLCFEGLELNAQIIVDDSHPRSAAPTGSYINQSMPRVLNYCTKLYISFKTELNISRNFCGNSTFISVTESVYWGRILQGSQSLKF